ncbi:glycosyltransferase family 2 protein [Aestuariivivens sediminis]|uniref:glycosyltransferase family 2 protein n=1 Tax=Aestuariivivens sediminis TaxID=2913557 RepID=UPI001F5654AC|nr:glycosyltransferase family 2 protein [Aestuariivivens sediminis]
MKYNPLVSIITVVYNGEKYLQQTIDSVNQQTYKNIEYIIIDGKSTDGTLDIIKRNESKITKWISEPDNGLYDAMNKGIRMANGELIGTINSDDWYELNAVELVIKSYQKNKEAKVFHANRYDVNSNNYKKEYRFKSSSFKFKYFSMTFSHPSMFIKREIYQEYVYNTHLKSYSDYEFILKLYLGRKNKIVHIPAPIVNFRLGGISAQMGFYEEIKEAFLARRLAGMSLIESVFALCLKVVLSPMVFIKNKLKNGFI